jgi:hypothetical protein
MAASTWDEVPTPTVRRKRSGPWLRAAALLAGLGLLGLFATAALATSLRGRGWPLARAVAARLQTEDGARNLYRRNPGLARVYPSEAAFLAEAAAWRDRLATLPAQAPQDDGRLYDLDARPDQLRISARGDGGAWLVLTWRGGLISTPAEAGEGLETLAFAGSREEAERRAEAQEEARRAQDWGRFADLAATLRSEGATRDLIRRQPWLKGDRETEEAFLARMARLRPRLGEIPAELSAPAGEEGGGLVRHHAFGGLETSWTAPDGWTLGARWEGSSLRRIEGGRLD